MGGHVVVVAVEGPRRQPDPTGEVVQLRVGGVAHEVGKHGAVRGPLRRVDEDHGWVSLAVDNSRGSRRGRHTVEERAGSQGPRPQSEE